MTKSIATVVFAVVWILSILLAAKFSIDRRRPVLLWALLAAIVGPISPLIVLFLPQLPSARESVAGVTPARKLGVKEWVLAVMLLSWCVILVVTKISMVTNRIGLDTVNNHCGEWVTVGGVVTTVKTPGQFSLGDFALSDGSAYFSPFPVEMSTRYGLPLVNDKLDVYGKVLCVGQLPTKLLEGAREKR